MTGLGRLVARLAVTLSCGWCGKTLTGCPEEARGRAYCSESHARKALAS